MQEMFEGLEGECVENEKRYNRKYAVFNYMYALRLEHVVSRRFHGESLTMEEKCGENRTLYELLLRDIAPGIKRARTDSHHPPSERQPLSLGLGSSK